MTDRPIIFNGQMVNSILAGRKNATRRIVKNNQLRWEVGDRLWVRESVKVLSFVGLDLCDAQGFTPYRYLVSYNADEKQAWWWTQEKLKTLGSKPSIHMSRWASRLTCIVNQVSIEPLREITDQGAIEEGIFETSKGWTHAPDAVTHETPVAAFKALWNGINGSQTSNWKANPTVAAISFVPLHLNIDDIPQETF